MEVGSSGEWRKKNGRRRKRRLAGCACIKLSRAKACGATQPCHVKPAGTRVPAWQLSRAEAYGMTLQGVVPRDLVRPKELVFRNLDLDGLLLKY